MSVLVAAGIFFSSAQTGYVSGNASAAVADFVRAIFPPVAALEDIVPLGFLVRKGAHVIVFFALAFCVAQSLKFYIHKWQLLLTSWAIASAYGVFDEIHQYFVPGRSMEFSDMLINSVGAFIGAGLVVALLYRPQKLKDG